MLLFSLRNIYIGVDWRFVMLKKFANKGREMKEEREKGGENVRERMEFERKR